MDTFNAIGQQFLSMAGKFPDRISIALFIGLICLALLFALYIFLFYKRIIHLLYRPVKDHWSTVISNLLTNFLLYADDPDIPDPVAVVIPKIEKLPLNRRYLNQMLYNQIIKYHSSFTGHTADKLQELFLVLKLDKIALKKIKSSRREVIIQGLRDIAVMNLEHYAPLVFKLTQSKYNTLRMEAQAAHMLLNKAHSFEFLNQVKEPILDWHQLVLIETAKQLKPNQLPDFSMWLDSPNPSVVKLCIKLVGHFQQFQAVDKLISLLSHHSIAIRLLAVRVLGEFEVEEAEPALLKLYAVGNKEIKLEVIKALGRICSTNQIDFLLSHATSDQFRIVFTAVKALKNHGESGLKEIRKMYPEAPKMNKEIVDQLLGIQINN